jgi:hypothetical protein
VGSPILHLFRSGSRISERIVGEPLEIGGRTIRPLVRVSGWRGAGGGALGGGAGMRLRVGSEAMIILEPDGREHRVPTPDNTHLILWTLAGAALMVAVASRLVPGVLR